MRQKSIRFRLTLWYSLALAAGLGLFALATWFSMSRSLLSDVDETLTGRAESLSKFINSEAGDSPNGLREEIDEYSRAFPRGTYLNLKDDKGSPVFASNDKFPWQAGANSGRTLGDVKWNGHGYRVLAQTLIVSGRPWRVEISESLDETEGILRRLRFLMMILVPIVIAIAALGGNWLSRRALKPVDEITAAARSIGLANLSERLSVSETGDELQRLSETWNAMLARLEDAVKRLSRFTADASHELRTPLAVIRTTAEVAARRSRSEESYREAFAQIVSEAERMTGLVEDLLFLARCDSEAVEMPMATLNVASVVEEVCCEVKTLAESKSIQLDLNLPKNGVPVLGNERAVRRLVLVLLDNAVKYSRAGGHVSVGLQENGDEVHLEISDDGPGIGESELPRIFERFYRAREARESAQDGSGLGLSLAAGIAQHHRARIEVRSVPGQGSTFRVLLPKAA